MYKRQGYAPGLAWHEYGIKSMNLSIGGIPCSMYKSILKEIQKRQKPKLLIVNATSFYYGNWNLDNEIYLRKWIDNIPVSYTHLDVYKRQGCGYISDNGFRGKGFNT